MEKRKKKGANHPEYGQVTNSITDRLKTIASDLVDAITEMMEEQEQSKKKVYRHNAVVMNLLHSAAYASLMAISAFEKDQILAKHGIEE